jgi:hypothetical protein
MMCDVQDQLDVGVKVVYVKLPNVAIELLHPLEANSAVAKFLEKNPTGGIHHLCFAVRLRTFHIHKKVFDVKLYVLFRKTE